MKKLFSGVSVRRFLVMLLGIVLIALGISIFKLSLMGNDPSSAMVMAIGDTIGTPFAPTLFVANCIWFVAEIIFGRKYIGIGSFANWFGVGIISSGFTKLINSVITLSPAFLPRLGVMLIGVVVLSLACSMYQTADVGIAPYDSLAIILEEKLKRVPYFWCRIAVDGLSALIAWLFGGIVGLGTLVCAMGLGPFVTFFDKHISRKLCGVERGK